MAHRLRTASTKQIHANALENIPEHHAVIILDFKQKVLKESCREAQREYFGKKAFASLHGAAILRPQTEEDRVSLENQTRDLQQQARYRKPNVQRRPTRVTIDVNVEFVDVFSEDTTQDSVWVFNVLELLAVHCRNNLPEMRTIEIWCDNAANYHNAEVARFSPLIWHQYGFGLTSLRFFEPGEGKSLLDRHFATVKHAIRKRVSSGLNFERINDLREVIEPLSSVHAYELTPNRNPIQLVSPRKIPKISTYHDWRYQHQDGNVLLQMYREVYNQRAPIPAGYTELLPYLPVSSNMILQYSLKQTGGVYRPAALGANLTMPPLSEPKQVFIDCNSLIQLRTLQNNSQQLFPQRWGVPTIRRRARFGPLTIRALTYFFHMGDIEGGNHINAEFVCDAISELIREGHINERALTAQQIKSWLSLEKRRRSSRPPWFIAHDPACIWRTTTAATSLTDDEDTTVQRDHGTSANIPAEDSTNNEEPSATSTTPQSVSPSSGSSTTRRTGRSSRSVTRSSGQQISISDLQPPTFAQPESSASTVQLLHRWIQSRRQSESTSESTSEQTERRSEQE